MGWLWWQYVMAAIVAVGIFGVLFVSASMIYSCLEDWFKTYEKEHK